jgi:hypothetical protein
MKTLLKILIFLSFICFIPFSVQANNELTLEVIEKCELHYGGDSCISELKITNNTNTDLDGKAVFAGWYDDNPLLQTPVGVDVSFGLSNKQTDWQKGTMIFSDFIIPQGETLTDLEIITYPALVPGPYVFSFSLLGMTNKDNYSSPVIIQGGGTVLIPIQKVEEEIPGPTREELLAKIRNIQMQIIILLYKLIIQTIQQLLLITI